MHYSCCFILSFILLQGPTEYTETLNRIAVISLAIIIKTRGIAEAEHLLYLPAMVEQILSSSQHTWSEKTLRYFPSVLREILMGRTDKRGLAVQAWQQVQMTFTSPPVHLPMFYQFVNL